MGHPTRVATDALTVEDVLQRTFAVTGHFNTTIHPADQMFTFAAAIRGSDEIARSEYFRSGAHLMHVLQQLVEWKFGSFANVPTLLDFASGYGRLTRFLVQHLPASNLWVSDIQADAVAFQEEQLGVHGFVSATNPDDLQCIQRFDCIFVASLFSHLPETTFIPWLRKLYSLLNPGGLLIFTTHDESRLDPNYVRPESGLWFHPDSEIAELDAQDYGVTFVTEAFMRKAIEQATGGRRDYHRIKQGIYHQDLFLLINSDHPDFSNLKFNFGSSGTLEYCRWTRPDELCAGGWAIDITEGSATPEIAIFVNGQLRQKCLPSGRRPDLRAYFNDDAYLYAGWECFGHVPDGNDTDLLVATMRTTGSIESLLYVGSIGALVAPLSSDSVDHLSIASLQALALQLKVDLNLSYQGIRTLMAELDLRLEYIGHLETILESKNAGLSNLENYARQLETELTAARTPRLPWKRRRASR